MNKKAKQLRELRNKIIYNGDVPLEFGCEVEIDNEYYIYIKYETEDFSEDKYFITKIDTNNGYGWREIIYNTSVITAFDEIQNNIKILGKPVTLQEVLLMIRNYDNIDAGSYYKMYTNGEIYNEVDELFVKIDLTKSVEEQDEEVLDKLLGILKN